MSRDHLFQLMALDKESIKQQRTENLEVYRNDDKLPTVKFKEGKDDRRTRFHPASFLRAPVCNQEVYWDKMPLKREHLYRNINLKPTGTEHAVADKAIEYLHNRTALISLKLFLPENINVTGKPLREIKKYEDQGLSTVTELAWENATSVTQIREALISYGICLQQIWPLDPSAWAMLKLVEKYRYCSNVANNRIRVQIVTNFFNKIARENAARAANKQPPLEFDKLEVILKAALVRNGQSSAVPTSDRPLEGSNGSYNGNAGSGSSSQNARRSGSNNRYNGSGSFQNGSQSSRPPAVFNGLKLCFGYNAVDGSNCVYTAAPNGGGCVNGRGSRFAHVCGKFMDAQQKYCLQKHRKIHHK